MKTRQACTMILSLAALTAACTLPGCKKGPAEKAGEKIDNAVEKTGEAIKDVAK